MLAFAAWPAARHRRPPAGQRSGRESDAAVLCVLFRQLYLTHPGRARRAGDQAAHLLWRLQHGGTFVRKPPAVAVVMIGTNDLGASACMGGQAAIVRAANGTATRCDESASEGVGGVMLV